MFSVLVFVLWEVCIVVDPRDTNSTYRILSGLWGFLLRSLQAGYTWFYRVYGAHGFAPYAKCDSRESGE